MLTGVAAIAAGQSHWLALKSDSTVWAWWTTSIYRQLNYGQLGNNSSAISLVPVQVVGASGAGGLFGVTAVAGGVLHSLALKSDGTVWAWGWGANGQLGNNSAANSSVPVQVVGPGGVEFLNLGVGTSVLTTNTSSLDFGFVTVGSAKERSFVITNTGQASLSGTVSAGTPFVLTGGATFQLDAGKSATVTIGVTAYVESRLTGTVSVQSNGGTATIDMLAMGVAPPTSLPVIDKIASPLPVGAVVVIAGANFGSAPGRLTIGGIEVQSVDSWGNLSIGARIPVGVQAGSQLVVVTTSAGSAKRRMQVLPPAPYLDPLNERRVSPGSDLVVDGYNLGADQGTSRVTINGIEASALRWSDTRLLVKVPGLPKGKWQLEVTTAGGSATKTVSVRDIIVLTSYGPCKSLIVDVCPPIVGFATERRGVATLDFENTSGRWYEVIVTPNGGAAMSALPILMWLGPGGKMTINSVTMPPFSSVKVELASDSNLALMLQALDLLAKVCKVTVGAPCPTLPVDLQDSAAVAVVGILVGNPALVKAAADLYDYVVSGTYVKAIDGTAALVNEALKAGVVDQLAVLGFESAALVGIEAGLSQVVIAYRVGSTLGKLAVFANSPLDGSMTFTSR